MPARVSDDDPRCGLASLQKFQGEDLNSRARTKYQQEQLREWSRLQQEDQRRAQNQQAAADQLFFAKQNELDQRAVELQRADEQCRRDINRSVRNYNDTLVSLLFELICTEKKDVKRTYTRRTPSHCLLHLFTSK